MKTKVRKLVRAWRPALLLLLAATALGWFAHNWEVAAVLSAAALAIGFQRTIRRNAPEESNNRGKQSKHAASGKGAPTPVSAGNRTGAADKPDDPDELTERLIVAGRSALLLRPQIARTLAPEQLRRAAETFDQAMSLVPEGHVLLESWREEADDSEDAEPRSRLVRIEAIYLDRYPVTNWQYQQFVDDGGYQQMALWDSSIWPAVLDFVDETGAPGPRFWRDGHYLPGLEDHPVVGVSWYEAAAYARWAGKRLPSDPEWVKAACWPVTADGTRPIQRRYPWGNSMDRARANIWGSGADGTVPVHEMPQGVSVGGAYHLIGNVWEWTTSDFGVWDTTARYLELATPMKSIRGGAFDTYFATQATCQFQSGECPVHRKRNIGFRCALSMCDVVSLESEREMPAETEPTVAMAGSAEEAG